MKPTYHRFSFWIHCASALCGYVAIEERTVKTQEDHGQFVTREPFTAVNKALSTWKELVALRKVERSGIPATGV